MVPQLWYHVNFKGESSMGYFAHIDDNNIVTQVIVADQGFIDSGAVGDPLKWIETAYNSDTDGTPSLRKNYAGIGYTYDAELDAFVPPKPFPSWTLDSNTAQWVPPIPMPLDDQPYKWDEQSNNWVVMPISVFEAPPVIE